MIEIVGGSLISILALTVICLVFCNKKKRTEDPDSPQGFVKFLEDSRSWAFDYIQDAQIEIQNFVNETEPIVDRALSNKDADKKDLRKALFEVQNNMEHLKNLLPKDK